jgi:glutamate formiminotransferase/formiminotetrahydrofolate cyclodeaminase
MLGSSKAHRQLVECVPNFSDGRRSEVLEAIIGAVERVDGVRLLSAEPDRDYNRSVVTFVGPPGGVVEAAFRATEVATARIDMREQKGEHPRMGATDVVPFVPVSGVTMEECVGLARAFGERIARELSIPVFLYEEAATRPARRNLAAIRKGEFEGLGAKLADPAWAPDFGPAHPHPTAGATVTGARTFLIAYNVNLSTDDVALAQEIALRIRESGRIRRGADGAPLVDAQGKKLSIPGTLRAVKAMGVLLEAHNIAQVSMNLVDFHITPPHVAYEEVARQASALGISVTGSEIVGMTPKEALLLAGRHWAGADEEDEQKLIAHAVERLGLGSLEKFVPEKKIIEYNL